MPRTHGMSKTPTYKCWCHFRDRCLNPKNRSFKNYGGRGIRVCERWLKFEAFFEDMGVKPRGTSLDRKNNDGHYHKRNCRWATPAQQARNTRSTLFITWEGRKRKLADVADSLGLTPKAAWQRLKRELALDYKKPVGSVTEHKRKRLNSKRFQARVTVNGRRSSLGYFRTRGEALAAIA